MSASSKKKLRKEQNAAAMTEKQQNELKEAKKLKTYTLTFIIVMALVVATVAGIVLRTPVTGLINNNTVAVTIGDHQLTSTQLNYFYSDAISELYSSYYNYYGNNAYLYAMIYEGVNFNAPLDEQTYDKETGATWADHFIDEAIKNAASVYTMYDLAMADESFKLTEDDQKSIDNAVGNQELYANLYGYSSLNAYLRATYGAGSTEKTYTDYYTVNYVASAYYEDKYEALDFKDADFREFEKDKFHQYSSFTYSTYYVNVTSYREGGTKDDKGNVTYSDAELKAAEEAAKKDADSLAGGTYADLKALNAAIISLEINKKNTNNSNNKAAATEYTDVLLNETNVSNKDIREWLGGERKANDVTSIEVSTTSKDENGKETKTVSGYYIVMYHSHKDNKILLPNVRHVLLKPEGGTYNSTTGATEYTDAARAAVKIKAQNMLKEWLAGEKTDAESFGELAKKNSTDTGSASKGGLYEKVYPGQMVANFNAWCFAEGRKAGDTGVVTSDYGAHIMYYEGTSDITYRDYLIDLDLKEETITKWHDEAVEKTTVVRGNLSGIDTGVIIAGQ